MDTHALIDIAPVTVARWRIAAERLADYSTAPILEIDDLQHEPTKHRLARAAKAARHTESITTGDAQLIANALASELETAACGSF